MKKTPDNDRFIAAFLFTMSLLSVAVVYMLEYQ